MPEGLKKWLKDSFQADSFKKSLPFIVLSLLGLLIYSNTFGASFHLDDKVMLENIKSIKGLVGKIGWIRIVTYFTLAVNYALHAEKVFGYHLVNIAIHIVSSILVYKVTLLTFKTPYFEGKKIEKKKHWLSFIVSLIFLVHPIQTQSVTYIVQRLSSLAGLFYFLTLYFYLKGRLEEKGLFFVAAFVSAFLSIFSKETGITLVAILILYEIYFFSKEKFSSFFKKSLYALPLLIPSYWLFSFYLRSPVGLFSAATTVDGKTITVSTYFFTQIRVITTYIRLLFFPWPQNLDYDFPLSFSFTEPSVLIAAFFLFLVFALAFFLFKKRRLASFGIIWFFMTLLVTSSIFPIKDVIFEHRLYLPLYGFALFLTAETYTFFNKNFKKEAGWYFLNTLLIIIAIFSLSTFARNGLWKDEITLWGDTIKKSPNKPRVNNTYGLALKRAGKIAAAKPYYLKAIEVYPEYVEAHNNIANVLAIEGKFEEALDEYRIAIKYDPENLSIRLNYAIILLKGEHYKEAKEEILIVLKEKPDLKVALKYLEIANNFLEGK